MTLTRIPIVSHTFDTPQRVCIEASLDTIIEQDLDTFDGEQYDYIDAVIAIDVSYATGVTFTTVRTHDAWKRGLPNAGRGTFVIPRAALEAIYI